MSYSDDFIEGMWKSAASDPSREADIWRKDKYQAWIKHDEYNLHSQYGWKIYQNPFHPDDYIVFHWQNMTERTKDGMGWVWQIKASGDRNVPYKGSCYIATLCYGDTLAPEVILLRRYRDQVLNKYFLGKAFVAFYYFVSPTLSHFLRHRRHTTAFIKNKILDKIINHLFI